MNLIEPSLCFCEVNVFFNDFLSRCNASSLNSYNISGKATLRVIDDIEKATQITAPVFIAKPTREVVVEGQEVSLDCAANGYPKPSIKWLKDGVTIDMK